MPAHTGKTCGYTDDTLQVPPCRCYDNTCVITTHIIKHRGKCWARCKIIHIFPQWLLTAICSYFRHNLFFGANSPLMTKDLNLPPTAFGMHHLWTHFSGPARSSVLTKGARSSLSSASSSGSSATVSFAGAVLTAFSRAAVSQQKVLSTRYKGRQKNIMNPCEVLSCVAAAHSTCLSTAQHYSHTSENPGVNLHCKSRFNFPNCVPKFL